MGVARACDTHFLASVAIQCLASVCSACCLHNAGGSCCLYLVQSSFLAKREKTSVPSSLLRAPTVSWCATRAHRQRLRPPLLEQPRELQFSSPKSGTCSKQFKSFFAWCRESFYFKRLAR